MVVLLVYSHLLVKWSAYGDVTDALFRSNQLPSVFGLFLTAGILAILVYTQGMKVEIPIVSTKYRGFAATYPIKMMYVSNIPVILASALTANAVFMGQMFWSQFNPRNNNVFLNILAQFDPTSTIIANWWTCLLYHSSKRFRFSSTRSYTSCWLCHIYDWNCNCLWKIMGGAWWTFSKESCTKSFRCRCSSTWIQTFKQTN